ncbi:MAG TPA: peptidylprolyl isomerase, partial [Candidatus Thalassarchaeum sp.]|nr:peptidylprolyl isomerase [Candidatus Thalassarchaeum sp.]
HAPGVLAMAKTSSPNTGSSQFYIVPEDSTPNHLDGVHTVFGMVVSGLDHVTAISEVATDSSDRPQDEVRLMHVTVND